MDGLDVGHAPDLWLTRCMRRFEDRQDRAPAGNSACKVGNAGKQDI